VFFRTDDGIELPAVTAEEMREVDRVAELISLANAGRGRILSLDVPSGADATTGHAPGAVIRPERTLTLALPKTGLAHVPGELYVADIGIPLAVYGRLSIVVQPFFRERYSVRVSFAG